MAAPLRRSLPSLGRALLTPALARMLSAAASDALVEIKPGEIGMVSGIPEEHLRRKVVIYSPARTASQQGSGKVGRWKINFLSTQKWENPLMGWTSTGDPYANVGEAGLTFNSAESAKAFAEKHGWNYVVRKRHTPLLKDELYFTVIFETSTGLRRYSCRNQANFEEMLDQLWDNPKAYAENFKWRGPPKPEQA